MRSPTDREIMFLLIGLISDGFNRSLGALEAAGAVDTTKMRSQYKGVGSKYYDIVTDQMVLTAKYGLPGVRRLFSEESEMPDEK